ncbi:phytochrome B [Perilla frutescens var. hirtella]|nr:phytochrome B [Perilla frutescens var. hirtella]
MELQTAKCKTSEATNTTMSSSIASNLKIDEKTMALYNADARLMAEFEQSRMSGNFFNYAKSVSFLPKTRSSEAKMTDYLTKIQRDGFVQSFGCVIAIEKPSFSVIGYSENCFDMLGLMGGGVVEGKLGLIGVDARTLFTAASTVTLAKASGLRDLSFLNPIWVHSRSNHRPFYAILHRTDVVIVIDLEPGHGGDPAAVHDGAVQSQKLAVRAISRLQSLPGGDVGALCDTVVEDVQRLTGYDRVMAYKFHEDNHGEVVAEIRRSDLKPYLGVHYPATDIPQAARFLFKQNRVRMIYDCNAKPIKIIQSEKLSSLFVWSILPSSHNIMNLLKCDGAELYYGGKCWLLGVTPSEAKLHDIVEWLLSTLGDAAGLSTDCLADAGYPGPAVLGDVVCGMAAARIAARDFLFWFRSNMAKEFKWGCAKHHPKDEDDVGKMHPRSSFNAFLEGEESGPKLGVDSQHKDSDGAQVDELAAVATEMARLIETAIVPIFGVDSSGLINGWNAKICELTGLELFEVIRMSLVPDVIHEDSREVVKNLLAGDLQDKEDKNIEVKLRKFGVDVPNSAVYLLVNACTSRDCKNSVIGVCFVGQDVTDEKTVMDKFIRMQGDYKSIIQSVNPLIPPIFASDENACCSEWNAVMEKLIGQDVLTKFIILLYRAISGHDTKKLDFRFFNRRGEFVEEMKNPLNGIRFTHQLLEGSAISNDQKKFVETSDACGRQILSIIDDAQFGSLEEGKIKLKVEEYLLGNVVNAIGGGVVEVKLGLIGVDARTLFTAASTVTLTKVIGSRDLSFLNPIWVHSRSNHRPFYVILHMTNVGIVIDLEPGHGGALCDMVVEDVQRLTGYDRVMAYKFHEAEIRRSDLEPYLGVHYPATDIPQAAWFLYKQNRVRMISDCNAKPVKIIQSEKLKKPLCLVNSTLRAPHGSHTQYMTNMGSIASLRLAVIVNNGDSMKLWGLVVYHHVSPRYVPFPLRYACEFLMQTFGLQLYMELQMASQMADKKILQMQTFTLEDATGLSTDFLADAGYPGPAVLGDVVCGMAAARIAARDFLFWFRSNMAKQFKWGCAKHHPEDEDDGGKMHPRSSFNAFLEVVKSKSVPWEAAEINDIHSLQLIMRDYFHEGEESGPKLGLDSQHKDSDGAQVDELIAVGTEMARLIEMAIVPIFGVDSSGLINGWNAKICELTGLELFEAIGKSLVPDVIHEDSREVVKNLLAGALQGKEDKNMEVKLRKFGVDVPNSVVYLLVNACTSRDCKNSVIGLCFLGQDVTDEKTVMDKFIRMQGDYKSIIKSVNPLIPPIFASDENACCSEWNAIMEKLTGQDVLTKFMILLYRAISGHDTKKLDFRFFNRRGEFVEEMKNPLNGICFTHQLLEGSAILDDQKKFLETSDACGRQILSIIDDAQFGSSEEGKIKLKVEMFLLGNVVNAIGGGVVEVKFGLIGVDARTLFTAASTVTLAKAIGSRDLSFLNPIWVHYRSNHRPFYAILHRTDVGIVIDLEPGHGGDPAAVHAGAVQSQKLAGLCDTVVEDVQRLTGYDRVMAYKFHEDNHGEVVAKIRRSDLDAHLRVHYLAMDIPQAARFLFKQNRVRMIYDSNAKIVKIILSEKLKHPLCLVNSSLRAPHGCHTQYMTNMGSIASLGLAVIAFDLQLYMELQMASQMADKKILQMQTLLSDMLLRDAPLCIVTQCPNIMNLLKCDGDELYYGGKWWLLGVTPSEAELHDSEMPRDEDDGGKMHPRSSFNAFLEVVKSKSVPWEATEINAIHSLQLIMRDSFREGEESGPKLGVDSQHKDYDGAQVDELAAVATEMARLIETPIVPIFGVDSSGLINGWNAKICELTGLELSEAIGKSLVPDVIHEDSREVVKNLLAGDLQGKEDKNVEVKLRKFGVDVPSSAVYLLVNACTSRDCKNSVIGVCFMGQDVTDEKTVMDKFIRMQGDYKSIIQSVNPLIPPIFASDENACCSEWNVVMEKLTGWMRREIIRNTLPGEIFGGLCQLKGQYVLTKFMILLYRAISGHDTEKLDFGFFNLRGGFVEEMKNPHNGIHFTHQLLEGSAISDDQKKFLETSDACGRQILSIIDDARFGSLEEGKIELKVEEFLLGNVVNAIVSQAMSLLREKNLCLIHDIPDQIRNLRVYGDQMKLQLALSDFLLCIVSHAPSPDG